MKKRKLLSLILAFAMALSLTACGGNDATPDTSADTAPIVDASPEPSTEPLYENITLSEYLSGGETIWLLLKGNYSGKDTVVDEIFVLDHDGSMYRADGEQATLGKLEQMEDADIAAMVKEAHDQRVSKGSGGYQTADLAELRRALFPSGYLCYELLGNPDLPEEELNMILEWSNVPAEAYDAVKDFASQYKAMILGTEPERMAAEIFEYDALAARNEDEIEGMIASQPEEVAQALRALLSACDAAAASVKEDLSGFIAEPGQYRLAITSDATGNQTSSLVFAYQETTFTELEQDDFPLYLSVPAGAAVTNCENVVYDSTYGGFSTGNGMFFTRIDSSYNFVLEQIGESDLPIDAEPEELFQ